MDNINKPAEAVEQVLDKVLPESEQWQPKPEEVPETVATPDALAPAESKSAEQIIDDLLVEPYVPMTCEQVMQPLFDKKKVDGETLGSLLEIVTKANNSLQQKVTQETFVFDGNWIMQIEDALFSIEKIAKNPKSGIAEDRLVVPIEKSKKITSESVRHLCANSGNIRGFDEHGVVKPSKILNIMLEEEKKIYENRFVYTLIRKLITFIDMRIKTVRDRINTYTTSHIYHNSHFRLKKSEVYYNLQIKIKRKTDSGDEYEQNLKLLAKVESIRKRLTVLEATEFCRTMANSKPVSAPIMKTNILMMNVDYKNCYKLWLFISGYTDLGFFVDVTDKNVDMDTDYFDDLTLLTALSVKTMIENDLIRDTVRKKIPFSTKARRYRIVDKITYTADKAADDTLDPEAVLNQFYFDKLKDLIKKYGSNNPLIREHKILPEFSKFYKGLAMINQKLYDDVLRLKITDDIPQKMTTLAQKRYLIKQQKEKIVKLKKLTKMMAISVKEQIAREAKEIKRLQRQEAALDRYIILRQKEKEKRLKEKALTNEKARLELAAIQAKAKAQRDAKRDAERKAKQDAIAANRELVRMRKAAARQALQEFRAADAIYQRHAKKSQLAEEKALAAEQAAAQALTLLEEARAAEQAATATAKSAAGEAALAQKQVRTSTTLINKATQAQKSADAKIAKLQKSCEQKEAEIAKLKEKAEECLDNYKQALAHLEAQKGEETSAKATQTKAAAVAKRASAEADSAMQEAAKINEKMRNSRGRKADKLAPVAEKATKEAQMLTARAIEAHTLSEQAQKILDDAAALLKSAQHEADKEAEASKKASAALSQKQQELLEALEQIKEQENQKSVAKNDEDAAVNVVNEAKFALIKVAEVQKAAEAEANEAKGKLRELDATYKKLQQTATNSRKESDVLAKITAEKQQIAYEKQVAIPEQTDSVLVDEETIETNN